MKFKKEFIIGLTTILVCVSAYFGIRFFQGNNPFVTAKNHYAIYPEINNLQVGNSVLISGLKVGQVTNTALIEDAKVRVDFSIENSYPIPKNTIAEIIENGLMGGMAVNLNLGNSSEIAESDMQLLGNLQDGLFTKVGKQLEPLSEQGGAFMEKFDSLLAVYTRLGEHLDEKIEDLELQKTLTSFQSLANNLQETSLVAKQAMSAMNSKVDSLNINQINALTNHVDALVLNTNTLIETMQNEDGSLHKLMTDSTLYQNFTASGAELEHLLRDLREHPKRYVHFSVFGKKDKNKSSD